MDKATVGLRARPGLLARRPQDRTRAGGSCGEISPSPLSTLTPASQLRLPTVGGRNT